MVRAALLACLLLLFAGCTAPPEPVNDPLELGYKLTATNVPTTATAGANFTFHLSITNGDVRTTDHLGAHYWDFDTADPTADFTQQKGGCAHVTGVSTFPGEFDITCKIANPGTYYLHGHVRWVADNVTMNDWSDVHAIVVA